MFLKIVIGSILIFLVRLGYKSFIDGINNKDKSYWFTQSGTLSAKQTRVLNIVAGAVVMITCLIGWIFLFI